VAIALGAWWLTMGWKRANYPSEADVYFISGLISHKSPFIVVKTGGGFCS
jgi:hypothetical protein